MIKRFDCNDGIENPCTTGDCVYYEDYQRLESQLTAIVERTQEWHEIADLRSAEIQRLEAKLAAASERERVVVLMMNRIHLMLLEGKYGSAKIEIEQALAQVKGGCMGWEQLPPEVPAWRQEFNACENCERLESQLATLVEAAQEALTVTHKGWQANKLKAAIAAATEVTCDR